MTLSCPIVGSHFYPPAKLLLSNIPLYFPLGLRPEPLNPYDPNATEVWLNPLDLPLSLAENSDFIQALAGFGLDLPELLDSGPRKLGHLAAKPPKGTSPTAPYQYVGATHQLIKDTITNAIDRGQVYSQDPTPSTEPWLLDDDSGVLWGAATFSLGDSQTWIAVLDL